MTHKHFLKPMWLSPTVPVKAAVLFTLCEEADWSTILLCLIACKLAKMLFFFFSVEKSPCPFVLPQPSKTQTVMAFRCVCGHSEPTVVSPTIFCKLEHRSTLILGACMPALQHHLCLCVCVYLFL